MSQFLFIIALFLLNCLSAYPHNPNVPAEYWIQTEPYFLPKDHPIKAKLDKIFSKRRVTESTASFEKAGFGKVKLNPKGNLVLGRHRELTGFLVKAFLDEQAPCCEWYNWIQRIDGANAIRDCIKRNGFKDFVIPKKWIYPLPEKPAPDPSLGPQRKNFILIVEDMRISSNDANLKAYKSKISKKHLEQLFVIIEEVGLLDSVYPDNIPFTTKGKIAFIDTEHHHHELIPLQILNHFLSPSMQAYWNKLINQ